MSADAPSTGVAVVVGLVSHNDGRTAAAVCDAIQQGLRHFDRTRCRVVWADSGSTDETAARVREAFAATRIVEVPSTPTPTDRLQLPYHGIPGKARALQGILTAARDLDSDACVILDAGVATVQPQWIEWLARPILAHDFDLVLSYYFRAPHEGALTKGLVYPLVRALYGVRLRQPAAAEFGCSRRLLERLLDEDLWDGEAAQVGIDIRLTTAAAAADLRLGEAALGARETRGGEEEALGLDTTLAQVVGALFADVEQRAQRWQRVRGSAAVTQFGNPPPPAPEPGAPIEVERLMESFRLGCRELRDIWTWVLPTKTIIDLGKLALQPPAAFAFDDDLWARIVYDFAVGYRMRVLARDHLLRSLVPLYVGWLASFILQVRESSPAEVDDRVERIAAAFEAQKAYLIGKWRWPERLRT